MPDVLFVLSNETRTSDLDAGQPEEPCILESKRGNLI